MPKKTARRGSRKTAKRNVRRKSKSSRRKSKSKSKAKKVSKIIASSYGLAAMMKEDQKGWKAQRVAKKDPYKKAKPPPIPSNIKGKKKKKSSSKPAKDSFLAGIDSKPSKGNWIDHVKNVWKEGKKKNADYKYKDAMKDAKKTWKN